MTHKLTLTEHVALTYLNQGGTVATHHIAKACGINRPTTEGGTSFARTMLLRLQRAGLVDGVSWRGGDVYWWKITDAGRKAVQP